MPIAPLPRRPDARFLVAFALLALVAHELHELAHTTAVLAACGRFGVRGFNAWSLPEGCATLVPTAMGPLFSYGVMLAGVLLLRAGAERLRWLGLALVFAPNPFARLLTAGMGGGDEGVLARAATGAPGTAARALALVVVALACAVPLAAAWRALPRAGRGRWYATLLLTPIVTTGVLFLALGDRLLAAGVLAGEWGGAPLLVHLATAVSVAGLLVTWRWIGGRAVAG